MGDIADMMLDGTLCQCCGEYLGGEDGFPGYCHPCQVDQDRHDKAARKAGNIERNARQKKVKCPECGKKVKEVGLEDHRRDSHGAGAH